MFVFFQSVVSAKVDPDTIVVDYSPWKSEGQKFEILEQKIGEKSVEIVMNEKGMINKPQDLLLI